jgi:hypothetical protein
MYDIERHTEISESTVMNVIFDACRANVKREPRQVSGFAVSFNLLANGNEHEAVMRDTTGTVVGMAIVDGVDC